MRNIKAVLFDLDGVLINTEPLHHRVWKEVLHSRGVEIKDDDYKTCIGTTQGFLIDLVRNNYGVDLENDKELKTDAMKVKKRLIAKEGFPEIPGVKGMLEKLHEAGFQLAIASSSPVSYIELAMDYLGVKQYFHVLNSADNVEHSKPAPDVYLDTAKKLGVEPECCVVLEDSTNGVLSAVSAGMLCVGFYNPDSGDQNLDRAEAVIHELKEFTPELIKSLG